MTARETTKAQMVGLVRNALLVAGQEMGIEGDHWPVINATIHSIMRDWENLQVEHNVDAELKTHLYQQLEIMERGIAQCSPEIRTNISPKLKELRELFDAYFSNVDEKAAALDEDEIPIHIKRAKAIIHTLEGKND